MPDFKAPTLRNEFTDKKEHFSTLVLMLNYYNTYITIQDEQKTWD